MTTPARMTIGSFAQATGLSAKALRLYDDLGLLRPAQVDPDSGYRRYDPAQLTDARLIGLLRRADLPLNDIRLLLDTPAPERPAALRAHLARLDHLHRERRDLTLYLISRLQGETPMTLPPSRPASSPSRTSPACPVTCSSLTCPRPFRAACRPCWTTSPRRARWRARRS